MASGREDVISITNVVDWVDSLPLPQGICYDWRATPCREGCERGVDGEWKGVLVVTHL